MITIFKNSSLELLKVIKDTLAAYVGVAEKCLGRFVNLLGKLLGTFRVLGVFFSAILTHHPTTAKVGFSK